LGVFQNQVFSFETKSKIAIDSDVGLEKGEPMKILMTAGILTLMQSLPATAVTTLSAGYVPSAYSSGCKPAFPDDYMEKVPWSNRRIEPRDCAALRITTPVFSWVLPPNQSATNKIMKVVVKRYSDNATFSQDSTLPRLIFSQQLLPGAYDWYMEYTNSNNKPEGTKRRRFSVVYGSNFRLLQGADFANLVAAKTQRPRSLPKGASFQTVAQLASQGEYRFSYAAFLQTVAKMAADTNQTNNLYSPPADKTIADYQNNSGLFNQYLNAVHDLSKTEGQAIEYLGYAYHLTGIDDYRRAGIKRLLALSKWNPSGISSQTQQDQANRVIFRSLGLGLDLFYASLNSAERLQVVGIMKNRLNQYFSKLNHIDLRPYDSHGLGALYYSTEALMYATGIPEFPEAKNMLAMSWNAMITMSGAWGGGTDGGFGNGTTYGWYTFIHFTRLLAAVKLVTNINLTEWPVYGNYGKNLIAQTPPNAYMRGQFGDELETNLFYPQYALDDFRLYASVTRNPVYEWYWRVNPGNVTYASARHPYHYLMLTTTPAPLVGPIATPTSTNDLPDSFLFEDAGYVAMHSDTTDSLRSSVFFRSSRMGSENHSHADNNAFTFVSKGKELLISGGYYDYYGSDHHLKVTRATRFKNTLTFDGGLGQAEPDPIPLPNNPGAPKFSMNTHGQIINYADTGAWAVSTGDATPAYAPLLNNAVRTVAYNRAQGLIVIYDWATSPINRKWELNFVMPFLPGGTATLLQAKNGMEKACIEVVLRPGEVGTFSAASVLPKPSTSDANQFRSVFSVRAAKNDLASVTLIREGCKPMSIKVNFAGTGATILLNGAPALSADQRAVQILN